MKKSIITKSCPECIEMCNKINSDQHSLINRQFDEIEQLTKQNKKYKTALKKIIDQIHELCPAEKDYMKARAMAIKALRES